MPDAGALVEVRDLRIRFQGAPRDALDGISLDLLPGERIGILGPSGSGKSTLALALAGAFPGLVPASVSGTVVWPGGTPAVAVVQQDVDAQLVALSVEGEIAFALENRGLDPPGIDRRIAEALASGPAHGLAPGEATLALSTGWRQRLAIAAALAEEASLTIVDEPTAHLDEDAAIAALGHVAARCRGAVLAVEHRADLLAGRVKRLVLLGRNGSLLADGPAGEVLALAAARPDLGLRLPPAVRVARAWTTRGLWSGAALPADTAALMRALRENPRREEMKALAIEVLAPQKIVPAAVGKPLLRLDAVTLERAGKPVIGDVSASLAEGEVVGVTGPNGAGKSSLAQLASGLLRPTSGTRTLASGRVPVFVPQNPALVFASATLELEARRRGLDWRRAAVQLERFGLAADPARHPFRHSRGELRRIALALALASEPGLLVLDEPTAGLDAHGLAALDGALQTHARSGGAALVISHDLDWLARVAHRIVVLDAGRVWAEGDPVRICLQAVRGELPLAAPPAAALAARLGWEPADA